MTRAQTGNKSPKNISKQFSGTLDGRLHTDPDGLAFTIFNPVTPAEAKASGVIPMPEDKVFAGVLALPKGGALQFKALILRSPHGTATLYVDSDRDGRFETKERISFHPINPPSDEMKEAAIFDVSLPDGLFKTCPMEVKLLKDGVQSPATPAQLGVLYTSFAFVEGYATLPKRKLLVRLAYNFAKQSVDVNHGLEWLDINGDGHIDQTPGNGEVLRASGSAPVFKIDGLTLQMQSVDLIHNRFTLHTVPDTEYRRISLTVGSILPDFEFVNFAGTRRHLSDVKGSYILLDFWASWCRPCVADLPIQKKAYEKFHGRGFEILGMNGDETLENPTKMLQSMNINWEQARIDKDLYEQRFQISQWPTMILIDDHRKIVMVGSPLDGDNLSKTLDSLMH